LCEKEGENVSIDPSVLAELVFDDFGLNKQQKLNKEQFIKGYL
jgi:hypothetical protein